MTGFSPDPSNGDPGYGSGMLLGPIAQMAATDPRRLLVQSLLGQGQQALNHPMYSKFSALANALAGASGGIANTELNKQYQKMQGDYLNQLRQAYAPQGGQQEQAAPPAGPAPPVAPAAPPVAAGGPSPGAASASIQATPLPPVGVPQPASQDALFSNLERQYGLPGGTLGRLMQTESSGVPRPGPALPGGQHANGYFQFTPETAARYGVTPGDLTSEATGAAQYLADLTKRNGGNFSKALVDYGGFQTKDPSSYIGKVTGGPPGAQLAQATPPQIQPAQQQTPPTAQPQPPAGVPGTDPVAVQMAIARQMANSPNFLVRLQGLQKLGELQQAGAVAYMKGRGEEEGKGAAALGPTGTAAQIAARTPAEAAEEAAKINATAGPAAAAAKLKAEAEAAGKAGYTLADREVITPDGPQTLPMTDKQALDIALGRTPGVNFAPRPTAANAPIIADQQKSMLDPARKSYTDNEQTKAAIRAMMTLSQGITTGNLTPHIAEINNTLQNVGLPQIDPQHFDANTAAALHKTLSQLVLNRIQTAQSEGGTGASRGNRLLFQIIQDTKPSLETPGPAIQGIGQNMIKMIDVDQARNKQMLDDATDARKKAQPLPSNWETNFWDSYNKSNPNWDTKFAQEFAQSVRPAGAPAQAAQPQFSHTATGPKGEKMGWDGQKWVPIPDAAGATP